MTMYIILSLRAGRFWDRMAVGVWFSALVQTGPGAHPDSYKMGNGSLSLGYSSGGVALTTHPHLAPGLKKE